MVDNSKRLSIILLVISVLRRVKDNQFMSKITEELLYSFLALIDFLYVDLKEKSSNDVSLTEETNIQLILMKEVIALIGNLIVNEGNTQLFIDKSIHLILIDNIITFINFPKLVKICIGTLINLSVESFVKESLSKVPAFIKALFLVMDTYKENSAITDYLLKLLLNAVKNEQLEKTLNSSDIHLYLLLYLKYFYQNEDIVSNTIKLIRILIDKRKGYSEFKLRLSSFYAIALSEKPKSVNKEASSPIAHFINDLIFLLESYLMDYSSTIDILMLIGIISTNEEADFKSLIEKSTNFISILKRIIEHYNHNKEQKKGICQCVAQLPIEEFQLIN